MWVKRLTLVDFRSYKNLRLDFEKGVTTFIGLNGQGKTNIVESINFLSTLTSHRVSTSVPLIRRGQDRARVAATFMHEERELSLDIEILARGSNVARVNGTPAVRIRDVAGLVKVVTFAPEDLGLIRGEPSERRRLLDEMTVQRAPRIAGVRADYDRVISQRNALLKSMAGKPTKSAELRIWNEKLVQLGADISFARASLINDIDPYLNAQYRVISEETDVRVQYVPSSPQMMEQVVDVDQHLRERLEIALDQDLEFRRDEEIRRGVSLVGPHRDEMSIFLNGGLAKGYASHGETWSIALALRLASAELLKEEGINPIMILDDVFAELDRERREKLARSVKETSQVFVTAAVSNDVPDSLQGQAFLVSDGEVAAT